MRPSVVLVRSTHAQPGEAACGRGRRRGGGGELRAVNKSFYVLKGGYFCWALGRNLGLFPDTVLQHKMSKICFCKCVITKEKALQHLLNRNALMLLSTDAPDVGFRQSDEE